MQAGDFVPKDPAYAGTMTMTRELSPIEGGVSVEIRAENVPDGISAADHAAGLASSPANPAGCLQPGGDHRSDHVTTP